MTSDKAPEPKPFLLKMPVIAAFSVILGALLALFMRQEDFALGSFLILIFLNSVVVFLVTMAIIRGIRLFTDGLDSGRLLRDHLKKNPPGKPKNSPDSDDTSV